MVITVSVVNKFNDIQDFADSQDGLFRTFDDWKEAMKFAKAMVDLDFDVVITTWRVEYEQ